MECHRRSSYMEVLRFCAAILLVLLFFVSNTIYCDNGTFVAISENRSELLNVTYNSTVYCENETKAEKQSELTCFYNKCRDTTTDGQSQRITKECRSNKTYDNETEICEDRNTTCSTRHQSKVELTLRQEPMKKYLVEGNRILWICCFRNWFYSNDIVVFQWSIDDERLRNNWNQIRITNNTYYDDNNTICSKLSINSIWISKTIQCVVSYSESDKNGSVKDNLSLNLNLCVLPRPFVTISSKILQFNDSKMFELSCHLTSAVQEWANFTWYQDGLPINTSFGNLDITYPNLSVSQLQTSLRLQTYPVKFSCMAETELGSTILQNYSVVFNFSENYCKSYDYINELAVPQSHVKIRFENSKSCPYTETGKVELTLRHETINKYLVDGNRISLICCFRYWFNSSDFGEFQWSVDDQTIRNNWPQMMITNDTYKTICSNLTFDQMSTGSRTVQCDLNYIYYDNNSLIKDNLTLSLYLCVLPRPYITIEPETLRVKDSHMFELTCNLASAVKEGSNFSWFQDGLPISSSFGSMHRSMHRSYINQSMSQLGVSLRSQMDPFNFSCMADTKLGRTDLQNSTIAVFDYVGKYCGSGDYGEEQAVPQSHTTRGSGYATLTLLQEPNKKFLVEGNRISWICSISGRLNYNRGVNFQWSVDDQLITDNGDQITITNPSSSSRLTIDPIWNSGTIQCVGNYYYDENEETKGANLNINLNLCVLPRPSVIINPKTLYVNDSQMFELSCYLASAIEECAQFTWYKDGVPINSSPGSVYISYPKLGMSQLQISLRFQMNPVNFSCTATTKLGNTYLQNATVVVFDYSGKYCKSGDYDKELSVLQNHTKIRFDNTKSCPNTRKGKVELTLRQRPTKKYLVDGNRISLICCFRSWFNRWDAEEFQWTVDEQTTRTSWTQITITNDTSYDTYNAICSNLTIDQISTGSGTVQCTVNYTYYDNNGPINDILRLSSYLYVLPQPFVTINPKSVNVIDAQMFELSCCLTAASGELIHFTWFQDGFPIDLSSGSMSVSNPELGMSQLQTSLRLQMNPVIFSCMADTELGNTNRQNSTIVVFDYSEKYCKRFDYDRELAVFQSNTKIRFDILPSSCPNIETGKVELTLRQEPNKKYLVDGNRFSLICCFRCWYNRSVVEEFKWTVDDQTKRNNWTQTMKINDTFYDDNNTICSNLTFDPISAGSGTIQCTVIYIYYDKHSEIRENLSLSLYLCVFPRPFVNINPKTLHVNDSEIFEFTCYLTSAVEYGTNFSWYEDGNIIDQFCESRNITSQELNTSFLPTSVRLQSDPIIFSCMADTELGRTILSNATVTVFDYNAKYCQREYDEIRSMNWNITKLRSVDEQLCPGIASGNCSRMCSLNETSHPIWDSPNCTLCVSRPYRHLLQKLSEVEDEQNKTTAAVHIAKSLFEAIINETDSLTFYDLNASLIVIDTLANWRKEETAGDDEITSIVNVISNVLRPNNSAAWKQLKRENNAVTVVLLKSADVYGRSLANTLNGTNSTIVNTDNMVLEARSVNKSEGPLEFSYPTTWDETRSDKIWISAKALNDSFSSENISNISNVNIWCSYYRNIDGYLPSNDTSEVMSRVLSLTVKGLGNEQHLSEPVIVTLQHNKATRRTFDRTCAFWSFKNGTGGEWDSTGCSVNSTNRTHTVCKCNHLTNFAIVMSRNPSDSKVLSTMSIVGCSVSVAALILTVIIYVVNWKQWKSDQAAVLINLCVALIIANTLFLAGAERTGHENVCKAVSILLHYFFLAAFFLMLAEGVELLLYIIFVFHVRRKIETASLIAAAWGLPLIIVFISVIVAGTDEYISERDTATDICWLSVKHGLIWAFVGPAFCITVINLLILVIILKRISRARFAATDSEKKRRLRATFWNLSVICPMLGVSWLFGVLSFSFDHVVFQYMFVIANSLQGLLIFLFQAVLRNKKISEICCKPKKPKPKPVATIQEIPKPKEESPKPKQEEKKIGGVAQLLNYFQNMEKSGDFDASRSFLTTLSLSTTDQPQLNDSEVSTTAEVHSSNDASTSTSALDGVVVVELPTVQENLVAELPTIQENLVAELPTVQENLVAELATVQENFVAELSTIQEN